MANCKIGSSKLDQIQHLQRPSLHGCELQLKTARFVQKKEKPMNRPRSVISSIILLVFIFSSLCFAQVAVKRSATVLKVSDGDTIWVSIAGRRVKLRLLGIDTPEKFHCKKLDRDARKCGVGRKYMRRLGIAATYYAKELLRKGEGQSGLIRPWILRPSPGDALSARWHLLQRGCCQRRIRLPL